MAGSESDPRVDRLKMTYDELFVLFELLHRWEDENRVSEPRDDAERVALWNLKAALEPVIDEVFSPDYSESWTQRRSASLACDDANLTT